MPLRPLPRRTPDRVLSMDAGLLVLRLVVGSSFVLHGLDKLGDLTAAEALFASLDIPAPAVLAPFTQHIDEGFFVADGGFELVLLLGSASLALALTGAGRSSADAALGLPGHRQAAASWALKSIKHVPPRPQAITRGR